MKLGDSGLIAITSELERQVLQTRIVANDHHRIDVLADLAEPVQEHVCIGAVEIVGDDHLGVVTERRPDRIEGLARSPG